MPFPIKPIIFEGVWEWVGQPDDDIKLRIPSRIPSRRKGRSLFARPFYLEKMIHQP
jgi:fido (protein-threonine AMPylation protein)